MPHALLHYGSLFTPGHMPSTSPDGGEVNKPANQIETEEACRSLVSPIAQHFDGIGLQQRMIPVDIRTWYMRTAGSPSFSSWNCGTLPIPVSVLLSLGVSVYAFDSIMSIARQPDELVPIDRHQGIRQAQSEWESSMTILPSLQPELRYHREPPLVTGAKLMASRLQCTMPQNVFRCSTTLHFELTTIAARTSAVNTVPQAEEQACSVRHTHRIAFRTSIQRPLSRILIRSALPPGADEASHPWKENTKTQSLICDCKWGQRWLKHKMKLCQGLQNRFHEHKAANLRLDA